MSVQTDVLSGNHKIKSADLFILLTQTIQAPKKRIRHVRVTNTQKKRRKRSIVSKIEIKVQFPYVVQAQNEIFQIAYLSLLISDL